MLSANWLLPNIHYIFQLVRHALGASDCSGATFELPEGDSFSTCYITSGSWLKISVLMILVGPGLFQFAQAKAFNKLLFQLAFNKHLQVMVLKWS